MVDREALEASHFPPYEGGALPLELPIQFSEQPGSCPEGVAASTGAIPGRILWLAWSRRPRADIVEYGSGGWVRTSVPFETGYNALTVRPHTNLSTPE